MWEKLKPYIFYITFFLFILAFYINADRYDYDLWARLIAGMGFVQTGHALKVDFLSYTPTHTWFDHEWGSGVVFYLTHQLFGVAGFVFLQALLIFATFFTVTKIIKLRKVTSTTPYNFLFYYFAFIAMSYLISGPVRCHLFSFFLFSVFLYVLELARKDFNKPLIILPFLMILWNNLHGGCVSGIGLIVLYIIGEFLNKKPIKKYIYTLIPTVLVLPLNPWGFSYIKFLLMATTMPRPDIMEWWGLFCKYNLFAFMKFKLFATSLIFAEIIYIAKKLKSKSFDFDKTKFIVLLTTLFLAIEHVKMIPFAVISFSCFLYNDFYQIFNELTKNFFVKIAKYKDIFVYGLILFFAFSNINSKIFEPILRSNAYPFREIEFIKENKIEGNLLINFGLGSYASYKLYPQNKIYMDGRYEEVYYDSEMALFRKFFLKLDNWDEILQKYPPDIIVVEKFYPIYEQLKTMQEWKLVFEGKGFGVFVKTQAAKKSYKMPSSDINHYKKTLFDTDINFMIESNYDKNKR